MRKKIGAMLIALVAVLGLSATAAYASPNSSPSGVAHMFGGSSVQPNAFHTCTNGQGCVYSEANGTGSVLHIIFSQSGGACVNMPSGWNDAASSAELKFGSGFGMAWYKNAGCTGPRFLQPALTDTNFVDDVFSDLSNVNDNISSYEIGTVGSP